MDDVFLLVAFCIFIRESDVITVLDGFGDVENSFPVVWVKKDAGGFDGLAVGRDPEGAFGGRGGIEFAIKGKDDFVAIDFCGVDVEWVRGSCGLVLNVEVGEGGKIVASKILNDL